MAKAKKTDKQQKKPGSESTCGVRKMGTKYFCEACGAVIDIDHDNCPACGNKVNWGRAIIELRGGQKGF